MTLFQGDKSSDINAGLTILTFTTGSNFNGSAYLDVKADRWVSQNVIRRWTKFTVLQYQVADHIILPVILTNSDVCRSQLKVSHKNQIRQQ